jgi:hypothetical protein
MRNSDVLAEDRLTVALALVAMISALSSFAALLVQ